MPAVEFGHRFAEVRTVLATSVFERLIKPVKLENISGATLKSAKDLGEVQKDYFNSANHYSSVLNSEKTSSTEIADAALGLSQQLINLGRPGQARKVLDKNYYSIYDHDNERKVRYLESRFNEKFGWINDNEGNFQKAIERFIEIRNLYAEVDFDKLNTDEQNLLLTAYHFLGRAYFGLGKSGVDKQKNLLAARGYFRTHLEYASLNEDEKAYSHAWLARCYMSIGHAVLATEEIKWVKESFERHFRENNPDKGQMGVFYLLQGEWFSREGSYGPDREYFERAFVEFGKGVNAKGKAEALGGIGFSYWAERKYGAAIVYLVSAFRTSPLFIMSV